MSHSASLLEHVVHQASGKVQTCSSLCLIIMCMHMFEGHVYT